MSLFRKKMPLELTTILKSSGNKLVIAVTMFFLFMFNPEIKAQQTDVPYVPTPQQVVEEMLDLAGVSPNDYVIDLGSGDGRIVIAAAKRGAFGHGIDIDPARIEEANENARNEGVKDKVLFVQDNIFDTDFSRADVVTMYLLNSVNMILRPKLLEELRPGTRVVSHSFSMNSWKPDKQIKVGARDVYYWIIPAKVSGHWIWNTGGKDFGAEITQEFQKIEIVNVSAKKDLKVEDGVLSGEKIRFVAKDGDNGNNYVYSGRVAGNKINGIVQVRNGNYSAIENWTATKK